MATIADWLKIDGAYMLQTLNDARTRLDTAKDELDLDFSAVRRIDAAALIALEELAAKAQQKSVRVVLRGVNVQIYKVLKLSQLDRNFTFINQNKSAKRMTDSSPARSAG